MTIDEAIEFEKAEVKGERQLYDDGGFAEYHEQLAEWLEELKELRKMREDIESNAECLVQQGMEDAENRMQRILDDEKRISYQEGKAEMLKEINEKMADIVADKGNEYGVLCIEAYCDTFSDLEEWIADKLMENKNA